MDTSSKSMKLPMRLQVLIGLALGGVVVLFFVLLSLGGGSDDASAGASEEATSEEAEGAEEAEEAEEAPAKFAVEHEDDIPGGTTWVRFDISDHFTQGMIASGAQTDTCKALEEGFSAYPDSARVAIEGSFPTMDDHGNEKDSAILRPFYERETYEKINMDNCQTIDIWDLRDGGMINRQLLENR